VAGNVTTTITRRSASTRCLFYAGNAHHLRAESRWLFERLRPPHFARRSGAIRTATNANAADVRDSLSNADADPPSPAYVCTISSISISPPASSVLRCSLLSSATSAADGNISQSEGGEERREKAREEARAAEARAAEARATEASVRAAEASANASSTTAEIASKAEGATGILKIFHRVRDYVLPSTRLWYRLRVQVI